jgi:hypothetical protein
MQNEYRNYMAISANLKAKQDTAASASGNPQQETGECGKNAKTPRAKAKASKAKDQRGTRVKTREPEPQYRHANDNEAKDPRVMDMDTTELRERRDGRSNTSLPPGPTSGPALNAVH